MLFFFISYNVILLELEKMLATKTACYIEITSNNTIPLWSAATVNDG